MKLASPRVALAGSLDGLIGRVPLTLRAALAALVLTGLILAMVKERADILRGGTEVRLATAPVDPRDFFRGDYVVLSYEISQLQAGKLGAPGDFKPGEPVFVVLQPDSEGRSHAVAVSRKFPAASPGQVFIEGKVASRHICRPTTAGPRTCAPDEYAIRVTYGLESFFVPQGDGRRIERSDRSKIEVVAAVSPSGKAAIKRLLIDGKPRFEEALY
jgi:uncharacterized membrane-anchored protein